MAGRTRLPGAAGALIAGTVLAAVVHGGPRPQWWAVALPPGSTDVRVSSDARRAVVATVTFNRQRAVPERVVQVLDLRARQVLWLRSLPSPTCCAFPAVAMTPSAEVVALGGAHQTVVYGRAGAEVFSAALADGKLHVAVALAQDGRLLVVGEAPGRVAAFRTGRRVPVWVRDLSGGLQALALSRSAPSVLVVLRDRWTLLRADDGAILSAGAYGPARIAAAAVSHDGGRVGLVWKRRDEVMVAAVVDRGRPAWTRALRPGTVPLIQMDDAGRWLAVGDLLGRQAALITPDGRVLWSAHNGWSTVGLLPDGSHAATAQGQDVEIRSLPSGRVVGRYRLPGTPHLVRLSAGWLVVLGAASGKALPDALWVRPLGVRPSPTQFPASGNREADDGAGP